MLQIQHLQIRFSHPQGEVEAVKDFSLTVEEGQLIGIVGESGSGKSMTAHAIMGLLERKRVQVSGSVRFKGVELLELTRKDMRYSVIAVYVADLNAFCYLIYMIEPFILPFSTCFLALQSTSK